MICPRHCTSDTPRSLTQPLVVFRIGQRPADGVGETSGSGGRVASMSRRSAWSPSPTMVACSGFPSRSWIIGREARRRSAPLAHVSLPTNKSRPWVGLGAGATGSGVTRTHGGETTAWFWSRPCRMYSSRM